MPIRHAIWKVAEQPVPLIESALVTERLLEDMILAEPKILSDQWLLIGRQESSGFGGRVDLLAVAPDGGLVAQVVGNPDKTQSPLGAFRAGFLKINPGDFLSRRVGIARAVHRLLGFTLGHDDKTLTKNSKQQKTARGLMLSRASSNNPGDFLLSHAVTRAVPSAPAGLTSVFGMGTGVTLPTKSPENL